MLQIIHDPAKVATMRTEVAFLTESRSVEYGAVNSWLCQVGDRVEEGQPIVEVEAEKVIIEIPAPRSGVLVEIAAELGDEISIGTLLGVIEG